MRGGRQEWRFLLLPGVVLPAHAYSFGGDVAGVALVKSLQRVADFFRPAHSPPHRLLNLPRYLHLLGRGEVAADVVLGLFHAELRECIFICALCG